MGGLLHVRCQSGPGCKKLISHLGRPAERNELVHEEPAAPLEEGPPERELVSGRDK